MFIRRRGDSHSESPPSQKLVNLIAVAALAALAVCLLVLARPAHTQTDSPDGEPPADEKAAETQSGEQQAASLQRADAISPSSHVSEQYEGPGDPAVTYIFGDPDPVAKGRDLTYFIGVANFGGDPVAGATLTDTLPASVDFVSARAYTVEFDDSEEIIENEIPNACSEDAGTVECDLGDLPGGPSTKYVDIVVTPTQAGTIENTATVNGTPNDNPGNDSRTEETDVINAAVISSGGPLAEISTTDKLNCQVTHKDDFEGAFYPGTINADCGTFVAVGEEVFGPADFQYGSSVGPDTGEPDDDGGASDGDSGAADPGIGLDDPSVTPYTPVSQNTSGSGTEANPHEIETVVGLGDTDLTLTQTDSYVEGEELYTTEAVLTNNNESSSQEAILYRAGDCMLNGSDRGFGDTGEDPGSVQCRSFDYNFDESEEFFGEVPGDRALEMNPTAPESQYYEDVYSDVWDKVGARETFPDTVNRDLVDNGEGLSWNVSVPANGSASRSLQTKLDGVTEKAHLSTEKYGQSNLAAVGEEFSYYFDVYNDGPFPATNTIVTDDLPDNVDFVSATAYRYDTGFEEIEVEGACTEADGTVTCNFGDLEEFDYRFVEIIVRPTALGNITNTVSVASETPDTFLSDNEDSVETEVVPPSADMVVDQYTDVDGQNAVKGQRFTYFLDVYNDGPSTATNAVVTDTLPESVDFEGARAYTPTYDETTDEFSEVDIPGACDEENKTVTCELGDFTEFDFKTVEILVKPTAVGLITNTASVTNELTERNPANNESTHDTSVVEGDGEPLGTISGTIFEDGTSSGNELANTWVEVCSGSFNCEFTRTDSNGAYTVNLFSFGQYFVRAFPPFDSDASSNRVGPVTFSGDDLTGVDVVLTSPTPPPPGTTFGSQNTPTGQIPSVIIGQRNPLTTSGCAGGTATYTATGEYGGSITGSMAENPPGSGNYGTNFSLPFAGPATITISIDCPNDEPDETTAFNIYIDPSGHVREVDETPIVGATVELFRSDTADGPFTSVPDGSDIMSPSNRKNTDTTKSENPATDFEEAGHFGWDVIAGFYKVRATNPGCHAPGNSSQNFVDSRIMQIPPPVFDLDLRLECPIPEPPSITSPANDSFNNTGSVTISGTAEPGVTIEVFDGETSKGTTEANATTGAWSKTINNVPNGPHAYTATATDDLDNTSELSNSRTVTVDTTAPTVSSFGPTGSSEATTVNAFAVFNESVTGVSASSFKLTKSGVDVPANVSYDANTRRATLDPNGSLTPGATYTATLANTQIEDLAGNALAQGKSWTFKVKPTANPKPKPKKDKKKNKKKKKKKGGKKKRR